MEGFGVHTFRLVNAEGKSTFVKFHWKPKLGLQSVVWNEAVKINGADPDFHRRDLWAAIESGDYPEWELGVQLFDDAFAAKFDFDVLDATKLIPEEQPADQAHRADGPRPPRGQLLRRDRAGRLLHAERRARGRLQRRPAPAGAELLLPRHPGEAARRAEFTHIPINAPRCPFANFQQDGHMAMHNPKGRTNYEPNSLGAQGGPRESPAGYQTYAEPVQGPKVRARSETFSDHYSQARQFYISQAPIEQTHIANALTFELSKVETPAIRSKMVSHLLNIDAGLAEAVAKGLRLKEMPAPAAAARPTRQDLKPSDALSIVKNGPKTLRRPQGRGARHRRGRRGRPSRRWARPSRPRGRCSSSSRPRSAASRIPPAPGTTPTRSSKGAPRSSSTPSRSSRPRRGPRWLATLPAARDFVADAAAHRKFIAYAAAASARSWRRRARPSTRDSSRSTRPRRLRPVRRRLPQAPLLGSAAAER